MTRSDLRFYLVLLTPALLVLFLFIVAPIFNSIVLSFQRDIMGLPQLRDSFIGLKNYQELLSDPTAFNSARVSAIFVGATTFFELLLGLFIALLINYRFPARGAIRALVLIPWAIPTVVSAQMWRFLFNDAYGLINYALFGSETVRYIPWLAIPGAALAAIIVADIWKTSSFAALLILAGLQVIPVAMPTETSPESSMQATLDGKAIDARFSLQLSYQGRP